ncbi:MAG: hypothetical protein APF82_00930 [Sphingomonadales bacterium BRH_c42]|nr:MAG: hypothetical protein APF82_00930 [Sphingomonadales bacterium BRH_c42]
MASISLDINNIVRGRLSVSVTLKGVRLFNFRLKVAIAVMRLAGWISPVPFDVAVEEHETRT